MSQEIIKNLISSQIQFEGKPDLERFMKYFFDLYRIEIFKDGLDLILTKLEEKHLSFEVKEMKGWDTNVGCFLTEQKSFFDQTLGKFFAKTSQKIILRKLSYNVMAHEMAHALEFESGINLGEEFRQAIGYDMKDRVADIFTLRGEIKRLMVDALKAYKPEQFISELFARYFELLSISRNVCANGDFATQDVSDFFLNTSNFVREKFNPKIRKKINPHIARITSEIAQQVRLQPVEKKFIDQVNSSKVTQSSGNWSKTVKSNASWSKSMPNFSNQNKEIKDN